MAQYQGRVSKVFTSRYGGSFGLEGQYNLYFNTKVALPANVVEGVDVTFEAQMGRNGKSVYVEDATLKVVASQSQPGKEIAQQIGKRDDSIKYQSSRKDALAMVAMLLQSSALWPADKRPAQSKICGIIEDAVDRFTAVYFEDVDILGALDRTPPPEPQKAPEAQLPE